MIRTRRGLTEKARKKIKPSKPATVRMVRASVVEVVKRRLHKLGSRLSEAGLNRVKVLEKVSGPVPIKAVLAVLKVSTAIDQPAEKGRMAIPDCPF